MCKKIDNSVIEGDDDAAGPLGPARDSIESPRGRRTSARVRGSSEAWFTNLERDPCKSQPYLELLDLVHATNLVASLVHED